MELNHPTPEDSHALLAARAKESEAKLSQSLSDNQSLLVALSAEQSKNEQLAKVIEEQSAAMIDLQETNSALLRDKIWYERAHANNLRILKQINLMSRPDNKIEFAAVIMPTGPQAQSENKLSKEVSELLKGIAAIGKAYHDHFGKVVPF